MPRTSRDCYPPKKKDEVALTVLNKYVNYLSCAISSFITIFRPELILLGGGISNAKDLLITPLIKKLETNTFAAKQIGLPKITHAKLGNDAGKIGRAHV